MLQEVTNKTEERIKELNKDKEQWRKEETGTETKELDWRRQGDE